MRSFIRFNRGLLGMSSPLKLWVAMLIGANLVAPLFLLEHFEARLTLAAGLLGMALMAGLTGRYGFSRIVGLGHVAWLPMLAFLVGSVAEAPATSAFGFWLRTVIVLDAISLVLDASDAVRFVRGDRAETVAGLEPPLAALLSARRSISTPTEGTS
jgi:hypothetical protein